MHLLLSLQYTDENYVSDVVDLETMEVIENNGKVLTFYFTIVTFQFILDTVNT